MSGFAVDLFWGVVLGFITPWWTHYAFAPQSIVEAGLRLPRTFDAMFLTVPFWVMCNTFWISGRLTELSAQLGLNGFGSWLVAVPLLLGTALGMYRVSAFLPGVAGIRWKLVESDPQIDGRLARFVAGVPQRGAT